jgi:tripartite-type tricarboxylate transporter receptor subunit TctC
MIRFAARTYGAVLVLSAGSFAAGVANAQAPAYPTKSIRMVIALAPGGGVDTTGRFIAQKLNEAWRQPVVTENRPGREKGPGSNYQK